MKDKIKSAIQTENYSCGPLSILNALNFFNIKHDLNEYSLIESVGAKPEIGCDNEDIIRELEKNKYLKLNFYKDNSTKEDLIDELDKGNICLVNYYNCFSNVGHYSIIKDYDDDGFFFLDSSLGDLRLSYKNFIKNWHNTKKDTIGFFISISNKT